MDGLAGVRARVAEIETRLLAFQRPPATAATTTAATTAWATAAAAAGLSSAAGPTVVAPAGATAVQGVTGTPGTAAASASGSAVIAQAREYLGVPYLWGGTDPSRGLDCSGFTQLVYASQGIDLPRVSSQQATAGTPVASLAEAQPGDLLFFDYSPSRPGIDHVGIYLGDGQMIAAPQPGDVVKVQSAGQPTVIRRVLPPDAA
ncbi:C40 family peptidase [Geodermatophilus nigrescens]